jgi:hypothetical protein
MSAQLRGLAVKDRAKSIKDVKTSKMDGNVIESKTNQQNAHQRQLAKLQQSIIDAESKLKAILVSKRRADPLQEKFAIEDPLVAEDLISRSKAELQRIKQVQQEQANLKVDIYLF